MHCEIDRFFTEHVPRFIQCLEDFDRHIDRQAEPTSDVVLAELTSAINSSLANCAELETRLAGCDPAELKDAQIRYRQAIWPWFGQSWFMNHALSKPRGYAGDYQMLTSIYDGATKSKGLGGYLDRYFLNTTLARAVCSRMRLAHHFLNDQLAQRSGDVAVLNVACGPCREYLSGVEPAPHGKTTITLVDNDPLALDYVQAFVAPSISSKAHLNFIRYNALRMISGAVNVERFGRSDIIYSVGLCDYIPDKFLIPMLRGWHEALTPTGVVYVAFKDSRLYYTPEYQWLADWFFLQRTEEDCRQLFEQAGYDMGSLEMTRDETGVIMNFVGHCASSVFARLDGPQPDIATAHNDEHAAVREEN